MTLRKQRFIQAVLFLISLVSMVGLVLWLESLSFTTLCYTYHTGFPSGLSDILLGTFLWITLLFSFIFYLNLKPARLRLVKAVAWGALVAIGACLIVIIVNFKCATFF